ncbi:NDP-hexose 2,3-dehydratase family protein [Streptomyces goshikiensis]|uniref:NDP-hexose 2,3-dehydratase family protein n=1 Tax=Streptomyces goshikiensis TaxID=1942 RepID=UPI00366103AB
MGPRTGAGASLESGPRLRPCEDPGPAARIARSAVAAEGAHLPLDRFADWFERRRAAHPFRVDTIPFAELDGWSAEPGTGNLVHHSGRFFSVEGMEVRVDGAVAWQQPVIRQPEIGILGILVKEFGGVLHCLMQAKMEPGNAGLLQLSPTVQATRSNYTKVHRGAAVKYIDHFVRPRPGAVLADVLQSEHGSWFLHKHNRNMIVETTEEVPLDPDFQWFTFGQLTELLRLDNVVNMDARTVLSCAPRVDTGAAALHTDAEVRHWLNEARARHDVHVARVPLAGLPGWERDEHAVRHHQGRFFEVVAASVRAGSREVTGWTQPLIRPRGRGLVAFLSRRIGGVTHLLAHARREGGLREVVEIAPTVMYTPDNHAGRVGADRPPFLDLVLAAGPDRIRYEAVHSEEGGRFLDAQSRYLVVEADEDEAPLSAPDGYRWVTPGQLSLLVRQGHCINVQARTLMACLDAAAPATGSGTHG